MCICGKSSCNGLCDEAIGARTIEFLNNNNILDAEIGALVPVSAGSRDYYLVIGSQFYSLDPRVSSTKVMRDSNKVGNILKENPFKCDQFDLTRKLRAYGKASNKDVYSIIKTVTGIYDYKKVFIPVEPEKFVDLNLAGVEGAPLDMKPTFKKCKVASIKWAVDANSVFKGTLTCQPENDRSKAFHIQVEEYGKNYTIKSLIDMGNDTKLKRLIQMSKFGYIKPVVLMGKSITVMIDNTSLYKADDTGIKEIGKWTANSLSGIELINDQTIKALVLRYKDYFAVHRKMIAPYTVGIENTVDINTLK